MDGQPCTLTKYRIQCQLPDPRIADANPVHAPQRPEVLNVETMNGDFAWDEDIPGAELVAGKGKATPKPATLEERRIRMWASPQGAPKAADRRRGWLARDESFGQNPAALLDRPDSRRREGDDDAVVAGGTGRRNVSRFPESPGRRRRRRSTAAILPERIVVKNGTNTTSSSMATSRTGTIRCSRSRLCTRHDRRAPERHGRSRHSRRR